MIQPKLIALFIFLLVPFFNDAQTIRITRDFIVIDSTAKSVSYKKDIYRLTKELTTPYNDQLSKLRAIFIWVTDNIRYDYKFINKGKEIKGPDCKPGLNCVQIFNDWEMAYLKKILKKKKAICDGYSRLLKKMCDIAGIKCEMVEGYTKTKPYQIGITGTVDHAWNAVWLDSAYFLLDATWAAGSCDENEETGKLMKFHKGFNEYYWLTPFHDFSRDHYPKYGKWVLEPDYTKEKFADNPYYAPEVLSSINIITPEEGVIKARKGDTIHFKFDYKGDINYLQVNSNLFHNPIVYKPIKKGRYKIYQVDTIALKKQVYLAFKRNGDRYEFDFPVTDNSFYFLDVLFDYQRVLRYKIKIDRETP